MVENLTEYVAYALHAERLRHTVMKVWYAEMMRLRKQRRVPFLTGHVARLSLGHWSH